MVTSVFSLQTSLGTLGSEGMSPTISMRWQWGVQVCHHPPTGVLRQLCPGHTSHTLSQASSCLPSDSIQIGDGVGMGRVREIVKEKM